MAPPHDRRVEDEWFFRRGRAQTSASHRRRMPSRNSKSETFSVMAKQGTRGRLRDVSLKSGTNKLKGTGAYFNRDESRAARLLPPAHRPGEETTYLPPAAFTLGGPIVRNKTFFFFAYGHSRAVPRPGATRWVEAERRGTSPPAGAGSGSTIR